MAALPKKRILLIDDDSDFTSFLKLNLEVTGAYEVREENRSEHALAAARAFRPDLIFLDLMMPNVMGGKVAYQLEADEEFKDTPVVFLSASVTEGDKVKGDTIAEHPAFGKPVSPEEVITMIEKYLPKKILFIHHEEDFSSLLKLSIDRMPEYEALVATSGEAGLELIKTHNPDLVLLDILMPGMDGIETLNRIKEIAPDLPVAMVTAVYKEEEAKKCFDAGAYEYITKPVDFECLNTALLVKLF
ncbi:MAG: response regulator [Candidatus Methylomirabilales bacterium]